MSQSTPNIKKWTTEDVHQWLIGEVKVELSCADRFSEEDVSGDCLYSFEKEDILDLGIKHGPAVKISRYLRCLKEGTNYQAQFPAYVAQWSKEQVCQWLLQHVKVYSKYADRLKAEEVSGDCLVCFSKQDLQALEIKGGPSVKILKELKDLNSKPEPVLQPDPEDNRDLQDLNDVSVTPKPNVSQHLATKKSDSMNQPELNTVPDKSSLSSKNFSSKAKEQQEEQMSRPQALGARPKERVETEPQLISKNIIQDHLDHLISSDFEKFKFRLQSYKKSNQKPIPKGKLNDKNRIGVAELMTDHYGSKEALCIFKDVLEEIDQLDLASRFGKTLAEGQLNLERSSKEVLQKEGDQGYKLKNLLTCGGNSLDCYDRFVVVVNRTSPKQVQYLQFLTKLKLFCVLDFDPNSAAPGGLCHSYRESRVANLHTPSQYQEPLMSVIKNLNLYKQTSWVFCNGRHDLDDSDNKELDYKNWLRKSCKDVEQLVLFICNPEVLLRGRSLIIFLLLSPVNNEKDPVLDTYKSFLKTTEEESIISICASEKIFENWRELIHGKCESVIDSRSIYELSLSEICGTIMSLGPFVQSSGKLLPSSDASAVVLKQKDEDSLTFLDILCLNQCENTYDEKGQEFKDLRIKVEEDFYRGGTVKWWNFYFCDKDTEKPFVKRDKYEQVKKMIRSQLKDSNNVCVVLSLFHDPGCGGTTLAMHVMWDLRKEFRCAVLKDKALEKANLPDTVEQVITLMKLESPKLTPVLLLLDDSKETESPYALVSSIYNAAVEESFDKTAPNCKVVILNCVRSHSPKQQYQCNLKHSQFLTNKLTPDEQNEFEKKLKDLKETHEKPHNFYSFMIMKNNFDNEYIFKIVRDTLENFNFSTKEARLFAYLALINTFVEKSEISLSLCEDFLGIKMIHWQEDSVFERMKPYSNFVITEIVEDWGEYKGLRILHHSIASASLKELERICHLKLSDITMEMLHCDLFFRDGVVKDRFMLSIQKMLIERQKRKNDRAEREPFSSLIDRINQDEGRQMVQEIFVKASTRFEKSASIPQALARYLYLKHSDYAEALTWAEKAKNIKENPYTFDTIGQIQKSNLKSNMDREKNEMSHNPEDLDENLKIADKAIRAFKCAQALANKEDEPVDKALDDESDDYPKKSYTVYGYVRVLEVAFMVLEVLGKLPFFETSDPMKKKYLKSFLIKAIPITSVYKEDNEVNNRYTEVIRDHEHFLINLKTEVKETFDLLNDYYTYIKQDHSGYDSKNRWVVGDLFPKYIDLFCTTQVEIQKERQTKANLNVKIEIEERRTFLVERQCDTFAGILQHLDRPPEVEKITECYAFLQQQQHFINTGQKTKETINYILSLILLYLLKPNSKYVKSYDFLTSLLSKTLQDLRQGYPFPDPYYLFLLLFWPSPTQQNADIVSYVRAIRRSSLKHPTLLFRRSTVALLFLGKEEGLKRLVSKPQLDKDFKNVKQPALAQLWRNGDIFKEKAIIDQLQRVSGTIEQREVFANYGKLKIPVRPAYIASIRTGFSTEKVSFFLGFAIDGPLAYDIQYET